MRIYVRGLGGVPAWRLGGVPAVEQLLKLAEEHARNDEPESEWSCLVEADVRLSEALRRDESFQRTKRHVAESLAGVS